MSFDHEFGILGKSGRRFGGRATPGYSYIGGIFHMHFRMQRRSLAVLTAI